jgi:transposase
MLFLHSNGVGTSRAVRIYKTYGADATQGIVACADVGSQAEMLVTVALANKMARVIWALLVKGGTYRTPAAAA